MNKELSVLKMSAYWAKTGSWREIHRDLVLLFIWTKVRVTKDQLMRECFDLMTKHDYEDIMGMLDGYLSIIKQGSTWHYSLNQRGKEYAMERYTKATMYATDGV